MERTLRTSCRSEPSLRAPVLLRRRASCYPCWAEAKKKSSARKSTVGVGRWLFQTKSPFPQVPRYCLVTGKQNISRLESICRNIRLEECARRQTADADSSH